MAGEVTLGPDGARAAKPGTLVAATSRSRSQSGPRYVSRGGPEARARARHRSRCRSRAGCASTSGASTGGFTDCLLQRGAERVICVDVAYGELDWRLREDPRVTVLERVNARRLEPGQPPYAPGLIVDRRLLHLSREGAAGRRRVRRAAASTCSRS